MVAYYKMHPPTQAHPHKYTHIHAHIITEFEITEYQSFEYIAGTASYVGYLLLCIIDWRVRGYTVTKKQSEQITIGGYLLREHRRNMLDTFSGAVVLGNGHVNKNCVNTY